MIGTFIISLDFELHWGGVEKWPLVVDSGIEPLDDIETASKQSTYLQISPANYRNYFLNTRLAIPEMLRLFAHYQVHVTWATVGMLMHETKAELLANVPEAKPTFTDEFLSAYCYIESKGIGERELDDPFHYAPTLVKQILKTPFQELGTHTFAHYYCNEPGQTEDQFREDIRAAKRAAFKYGQKVRSLVFPRNQFNDSYLKVCFEEGITSVRSNPLDWFWKIDSTQKESTWKRLNRGADAYFSIGKKNTYSPSAIQVREGYPLCIPASRLLRPYNPKELLLNDFKINRIKAEMSRAARNGEIYHLWWHPHNFGNYPNQSLADLEEILQHFIYCNKNWNMQTFNMGELTSLLRGDR